MRVLPVALLVAVSVQAAPYFALSRTAGDGLNPGYPVFWSAVHGYGRNPAAADGHGWEAAMGLGGLPAGAESYDATLLFGGGKSLRWGLHAVGWRHEAFTVWEVDRFYDPREAGRIEPGGFVLGVGTSASLRWVFGGRMGLRVKLLHEDDAVAERSAMAVDAGALLRTPWLDAGLAFSDLGVPLFRAAAGWLPMAVNIGLMRQFPTGVSRPGVAAAFEAYDAALRVRAGGWWLYAPSPLLALGLQLDIEAGSPSSLTDGVSPAVYAALRGGGWKVGAWYRMRIAAELLHAAGVAFGF